MTAIFESRDRANQATEKLKIYAQPQRLMILSYLLRGESSVSEIDAATGIGQPALSQQLGALRQADVVKTRREGKQIWYDLADDASRLCVRTMEALLTDQPDPKRVMAAATLLGTSTEKPLAGSGTAGFAKIL
ncbi:ArsR/SmtB family transcription factor [Sphingorhabdus sp. M41]|uniref:ArsR/SmtB family transcription factor n=1 Tax=Sphingorhabdus sp. M41 TaxID=1806885 RepID=UPI00078DEFC6|nr:metalloregulator ArsR/SmtB family transcription factor [Sphingorhabdus sp. M41]AMO70680.1 ArsR family transcriptional regulator [Sphingorhabdus sp. M41]